MRGESGGRRRRCTRARRWSRGASGGARVLVARGEGTGAAAEGCRAARAGWCRVRADKGRRGRGEQRSSARVLSQVPAGPAQHVWDNFVAMLDCTSHISEREPVARVAGRQEDETALSSSDSRLLQAWVSLPAYTRAPSTHTLILPAPLPAADECVFLIARSRRLWASCSPLPLCGLVRDLAASEATSSLLVS